MTPIIRRPIIRKSPINKFNNLLLRHKKKDLKKKYPKSTLTKTKKGPSGEYKPIFLR